MKQFLFALSVVLLVFAVGAVSAESATADGILIQPTGPATVLHTATSSTYTATITCDNNFTLTLSVYLNGVRKHLSNTIIYNAGPTYNFSKVVSMTGWGLKDGDVLIYRGRAYYGAYSDQEDWQITVQ
jgi:hypothetical protein